MNTDVCSGQQTSRPRAFSCGLGMSCCCWACPAFLRCILFSSCPGLGVILVLRLSCLGCFPDLPWGAWDPLLDPAFSGDSLL